MNITRHKIRELAFQTLFLLSSNNISLETALKEVLATAKITQIPNYLHFLVQGVWQNHEQLDQQLSKYLKKNWTLQRLSRVDLNILRIGLFEIEQSTDIPVNVAINEALELAEQYSDPRSKKYINGILSNFVPVC